MHRLASLRFLNRPHRWLGLLLASLLVVSGLQTAATELRALEVAPQSAPDLRPNTPKASDLARLEREWRVPPLAAPAAPDGDGARAFVEWGLSVPAAAPPAMPAPETPLRSARHFPRQPSRAPPALLP